MSHDRIGGTKLPLTQEFLGQMLGARRATVSVAASVLQKAGTIAYTRGSVTFWTKRGLRKPPAIATRLWSSRKRNGTRKQKHVLAEEEDRAAVFLFHDPITAWLLAKHRQYTNLL